MILVDAVQWYDRRVTKLRYEYWCHMVSDLNVEELHEFAKTLGMRRSWFQNRERFPHYDITANKREQAIKLGAASVTGRELIQRAVKQGS